MQGQTDGIETKGRVVIRFSRDPGTQEVDAEGPEDAERSDEGVLVDVGDVRERDGEFDVFDEGHCSFCRMARRAERKTLERKGL